MTLDLDKLERLAKAATPGAVPWRAVVVDPSEGYLVLATGDGIATPTVIYVGTALRQEVAEYIAAASPDVVLRLIEVARGGARPEALGHRKLGEDTEAG